MCSCWWLKQRKEFSLTICNPTKSSTTIPWWKWNSRWNFLNPVWLIRLIRCKEVSPKMHPAVSRVLTGFCIIAADALFLTVLITVGKESSENAYLCPKFNSTSKNHSAPCWNWKFENSDGSCMFTLLFASTICLHIDILLFFLSAFLRCLVPEFILVAQRSLFFRCMGRYLPVVLNFAACILASSLVVYTAVRDSADHPPLCKKSALLWKNCHDKKKACWVFVILLAGCVFSLVATVLSALDARSSYSGRLAEEERERLYQSYIDYSSIKEVDTFWSSNQFSRGQLRDMSSLIMQSIVSCCGNLNS